MLIQTIDDGGIAAIVGEVMSSLFSTSLLHQCIMMRTSKLSRGVGVLRVWVAVDQVPREQGTRRGETMKCWQRRICHIAIVAVTVIAVMLGTTHDSHAQGKIRIAVTAFENKVKTPIPDARWKIGEGLAEMLTSELLKTGQFHCG